MSTGAIVGISIAVIIVVAGIITGIVFAVLNSKRKAKLKKVQDVSSITTSQPDEENKVKEEIVTLVAAARLNGTETDAEFKKRVSKLTKEEFQALGINEFPASIAEISKLIVTNKWDERKAHEETMIYSYDRNGNINSYNLDLLTRTFAIEEKVSKKK